MKNKILLYCPPPTLDSPSTRAPLALLAIASTVVSKGYDVKILPRDPGKHDEYFSKYKDDTIAYGVSVMTGPQIIYGIESSLKAKKIMAGVPVIWGGWHPTIFPEKTASHTAVDIAVIGQGEMAFAELIEALDSEKDLGSVSGLAFCRNGKTVLTKERDFADIKKFPPLSYDLLEMKDYIFSDEINSHTINYVSSRGCPYSCSYCAQYLVSKGHWSSLEPEQMIDDIEVLHSEYGIDGILFDDANFFVDLPRVGDFSQTLKDRDLKIKWGMANGRLEDLVDADSDYLSALKTSGLRSIFVGLEPRCGATGRSITKTYQRLIGRAQTLARCSGDAGIKLYLSVIIGFPHSDTGVWPFEEELNAALVFIKECSQLSDLFEGQLSLFLPFPHAPMYEQSLKNGLQAPETLEDWGAWMPDSLKMPWMPKGAINEVRELNRSLKEGKFR